MKITLPEMSTTGMVIAILILLVPMLPNFFAIFHAWRHNFPTPQERTLWLFCAVLLPAIGGIIYFVFGRKRVVRRNSIDDFLDPGEKVRTELDMEADPPE